MFRVLSRIVLLVALFAIVSATPAHAVLTLLNEFTAFGPGNAMGEVFVAMGNVSNSNPGDEIVAGHGAGGGGFVAVYTQTGSILGSAFGTFSTVGNPSGKAHVAIGEFDGTSPKEIVVNHGSTVPLGWGGTCTAPDKCGSGFVGVWNSAGVLQFPAFRAFATAGNASGEVFCSAGNVDASANDEIVCGKGYQAAGSADNRVAVFSNAGALITHFGTWGLGNPNGENPVAVGDFTAGGMEEIVVGHGRGGSSSIQFRTGSGASPAVIGPCATFGAGNAQGFVNLSAGQYDGVAGHEVIAGHGPGGLNFVGIFPGGGCGAAIDSGPAYTSGENPTGDVHVAGLK